MEQKIEDKFFRAVSNNDLETVSVMIEDGFNVNHIDRFGESAVHVAVDERALDVLRVLIKSEVDLNVKTKPGYTACHLAVLIGRFEVLKLLIEPGADKNIVDANGNTLLWNAVMRYNDDDKIVKYLLEIGFDPTIENDSGISALKILSMPKNESIRYLFSKWL